MAAYIPPGCTFIVGITIVAVPCCVACFLVNDVTDTQLWLIALAFLSLAFWVLKPRKYKA